MSKEVGAGGRFDIFLDSAFLTPGPNAYGPVIKLFWFSALSYCAVASSI